jgi:hypothetical protein
MCGVIGVAMAERITETARNKNIPQERTIEKVESTQNHKVSAKS